MRDRTVEVSDVNAYRVLTSEAKSGEPTVSQEAPHTPFSQSRLSSHLSRKFEETRIVLHLAYSFRGCVLVSRSTPHPPTSMATSYPAGRGEDIASSFCSTKSQFSPVFAPYSSDS